MGVWEADVASTGQYVLQSCPAGYALLNTLDSNYAEPFSTAFNHDFQRCQQCDTKFEYIINYNSTCRECPRCVKSPVWLLVFCLAQQSDSTKSWCRGLVCFGNSQHVPRVEGSVWREESGALKLVSCPRGYRCACPLIFHIWLVWWIADSFHSIPCLCLIVSKSTYETYTYLCVFIKVRSLAVCMYTDQLPVFTCRRYWDSCPSALNPFVHIHGCYLTTTGNASSILHTFFHESDKSLIFQLGQQHTFRAGMSGKNKSEHIECLQMLLSLRCGARGSKSDTRLRLYWSWFADNSEFIRFARVWMMSTTKCTQIKKTGTCSCRHIHYMNVQTGLCSWVWVCWGSVLYVYTMQARDLQAFWWESKVPSMPLRHLQWTRGQHCRLFAVSWRSYHCGDWQG